MSKGNPKRATDPERVFKKFNAQVRVEYLSKISKEGLQRTTAAEAVGINYTTVYHYCKVHPEFEDEIAKAFHSQLETVEDLLYKNCRNGNQRAIEFFLVNRGSERWVDGKMRATTATAEESAAQDVLPLVIEVLDKNPTAKAEVIKRMEMRSP